MYVYVRYKRWSRVREVGSLAFVLVRRGKKNIFDDEESAGAREPLRLLSDHQRLRRGAQSRASTRSWKWSERCTVPVINRIVLLSSFSGTANAAHAAANAFNAANTDDATT